MDVDGLNYESLLELGDKIGVATPGDGTWNGIDEEKLAKITMTTNPSYYLAQKQNGEDDAKCPICLGEFDANDSDSQLHTVVECNHTFHASCLRTWLATKTNCPVC